jgi:hypothetical protein
LGSWHIDDVSGEVRFTLKNRHRQPGLSGPKSATFGPTYLKISKHAHDELERVST